MCSGEAEAEAEADFLQKFRWTDHQKPRHLSVGSEALGNDLMSGKTLVYKQNQIKNWTGPFQVRLKTAKRLIGQRKRGKNLRVDPNQNRGPGPELIQEDEGSPTAQISCQSAVCTTGFDGGGQRSGHVCRSRNRDQRSLTLISTPKTLFPDAFILLLY